MKNIFQILAFIVKHPIGKRNKIVSLSRFFKWQLGQKFLPYPVCYPFVEETSLLISKGMEGATGNIYVGLHEFEDMAFLLHFLRPEDTFVDVGANIGSYSILASGVAGADTITIEPVSVVFKKLEKNVFLNNLGHKVQAFNVGAGAVEGKLYFTNKYDSLNHAVINPIDVEHLEEVSITTLDTLLSGKQAPCLIKIDVEGFETDVLNGAPDLLVNKSLKAIIIELLGSGSFFGYDEKDIHAKLIGLGFETYLYDAFNRELQKSSDYGSHNNRLYIRDIEFVKERVLKARKFKILSQHI